MELQRITLKLKHLGDLGKPKQPVFFIVDFSGVKVKLRHFFISAN